MQPFEATWPEIQARIDQIKAAHRVRHLTNCFAAPQADTLLTLASDEALLFGSLENGFWRLYYFAGQIGALQTLLQSWSADRDSVIGYVDKTRNENLCTAFMAAGFAERALYQRMTNPKLPVRKARSEPEFARVDETEHLHALLAETFDAMTDHLPEVEQLRKIVAAQQAIVSRTNGQITGALVFQLPSRQVNFNFLVNRGGSSMDLLALKNSFYHVIAQRGITSGFLWVDSRNTGVIKLHQAFGWKFDGLNDWFFARRAA